MFRKNGLYTSKTEVEMKQANRRNHILIYIMLIAGATVMIFPFIWSILTSFKSLSESLQFPPVSAGFMGLCELCRCLGTIAVY